MAVKISGAEDSAVKNTEGPVKTGMARLLQARQEFGNIAKNKNNDFFKSKYVDLAGVIDHTFPVLASHDIIVQQGLVQAENIDFGFVLQTKIIDTTTQNIVDIMEYPIACKDYKDPQKVGGAVTYARRYSLLTILGLAAEDDDGNLASQPAKEPKPAKSDSDVPSRSSLITRVQKELGVTTAEKLALLTEEKLGTQYSSFKDEALTVAKLKKLLDAGDAPAF